MVCRLGRALRLRSFVACSSVHVVETGFDPFYPRWRRTVLGGLCTYM